MITLLRRGGEALTMLIVPLLTAGCFPSFDGLDDGLGSHDAASEPVTSMPEGGGETPDVRNPHDANTSDVEADGVSPPKLLVKYDFDETSGVVVPDSSGNERHGRLEGTGTWVTGRVGNALHFDGATGYITMPVGIIGQRAELTFVMWVRLDAVAVWQRLFDFGKDANTYMFMTATDPIGAVRFAISRTGFNGEARIASTSGLPLGKWKHIALVLTADSAALYVDGVSESVASKFSPSPPDLGLTQNDWIGRSQYMADSYLKGTIDDFRIYEDALSPAAIFALSHPGT
jgi:uncharacterized protein